MYEDTIKFEHLLREGERSCNGGRWKSRNQMFEINLLRWVGTEHRKLERGDHSFRPTNDFYIHERGKTRRIRSHHIIDRTVQKSWCKYSLIPATAGKVMPHNSASQKDKGTDDAIKIFRQALAHAYRKYGRDFRVVTWDYHDYFGSIPHKGAEEEITSCLTDEGDIELFRQYTKVFEKKGSDHGYGIGGEPSQVISVVYPSSIDRMLACDPAVDDSGRYMDDGWAITKTPKDAKRVLDAVIRKSEEKGLTINYKSTRIFWMERDTVTFLKKRTRLDENGKIIMRIARKNIRDRHRLNKKQKKELDAGRMPRETIIQSLQCWFAYSRPYMNDEARMEVMREAMDLFEIPWEDMRLIMRGKAPRKQPTQNTRRYQDERGAAERARRDPRAAVHQ